MSDLALARNCCLARMLPGEADKSKIPVSGFSLLIGLAS